MLSTRDFKLGINGSHTPNQLTITNANHIVNGSLREPLSQAESKLYGSIFQTLDPNNSGIVSGGVSRPLLEASGLPLPTLGMVWNLADPENVGHLSLFNFCIAMRLIAHAQQGSPISIESANKVAPLAKFQSIKVNNTGSGILRTPSNDSRVSSVNSNMSSPNVPNVPALLPNQVENFGKMFDKTSPNGILPGDQAKGIFLKARLPIQVLERIWAVVDQDERGELTRPQFIIAMHLIQCFMNKSMTVMPTTIPDQMWRIAQVPVNNRTSSSSTINSASPAPPPLPPAPVLKQQHSGSAVSSNKTNLNTWIMSKQQKEQYGAIFETLDNDKRGSITGGEVANFLMTSKLPSGDLAAIWELANLDQASDFTKQEFSIAMYLIQKKLAGYQLPIDTPIELIQSSALTVQQQNIQPSNVSMPNHQSFDSAKEASALQRSASHMDDLLGIFKTAAPMPPANPTATNFGIVPPPAPVSRSQYQPSAPPAPAPRNSVLNDAHFTPVSNYGRNLTVESSDDDDGPENLDIPRMRDPPAVPGRSNKPHFDSSDNIPATETQQFQQPQSNYDVLKSLDNSQFNSFTSQPASNAASTVGGGFSNVAAAGVGAAAAAIGFTGAAAFNAASSNSSDVTNQLSNTSVDIANYSNQINSLSKQTSVVSSKKDKAQQELTKMLKTKETILGKLTQLKALHEQESQQVLEVQNMMLQAKQEVDELNNELSVSEANYHAEQTQLEKLQSEYDDSQKHSQSLKERLGTLNAESIDLKAQIEEFTSKSAQASNMFAVSQQQIVVQESQNEELRSKIEELKNSIFQIESQHKELLTKSSQLDDQQMDLHEAHTDASVSLAEKSVAFSESAALAAANGIHIGGGDEDENKDNVTDAQEVDEVPTASLDDFDESDFTSIDPIQSKEISTPVQKQVETLSDVSSPTGTNGMSNTIHTDTTPTQTIDDGEIEGAQEQSQFALPFNIPHSETSSTQNNPSQSVRGDLDAPGSPTSTISESAANNSDEIQETHTISHTHGENGESFEMVNHSDVTQSNTQIPPESTNTEIDDAVTDVPSTVVEAGDDDDELPTATIESTPVSAPVVPEVDTSSSDDFQDADELEPAVVATSADGVEDESTTISKNPFSNSDATASAVPAQVDDMFDDLGLEEAAVEDDGHAAEFDNTQVPASAGFSFSQTNSAAIANADGDDWEQVFAGFGNDPTLQPAIIENDNLQSQFTQHVIPDSGFSAIAHSASNATGGLSQSQKLAIEELKGMGFAENESLSALEKCGWNIDDASNFLLDI